MTSDQVNATTETLTVEKAVYGGDGLAHRRSGEVVFLPFTLPGEQVEVAPGEPVQSIRILQPSQERTDPGCVHFGTCGGCQYQMATYTEQLQIKGNILRETLERAGIDDVAGIRIVGSPEPYGYRNRIRLRVREVEGVLQLGYNRRGTNEFLRVRMCPIAAPVLWSTAEALMRLAAESKGVAEWLRASAEVEIACDDQAAKVQMHLLCAGQVPVGKGSFDRFAQGLASTAPVISAGASRLHAASGRAMEPLASWGAEGMTYRVAEDRFWLQRGSFFQVNRLLVPQMMDLVCGNRHGELAWDLFAGVGLFARRLARQFTAVTAVEANPVAAEELRRAQRRPGDRTETETTIAFLRKAVLQRQRPQLVVLDPPRAGTGEEACRLLARLQPAEIVYVSCDPTTLGRDVAVLFAGGYRVAEVHMIDLFPQTYHLETVMVLRYGSVEG